jgi:hypothetical protein
VDPQGRKIQMIPKMQKSYIPERLSLVCYFRGKQVAPEWKSRCHFSDPREHDASTRAQSLAPI